MAKPRTPAPKKAHAAEHHQAARGETPAEAGAQGEHEHDENPHEEPAHEEPDELTPEEPDELHATEAALYNARGTITTTKCGACKAGTVHVTDHTRYCPKCLTHWTFAPKR